MDAKTIMTIFNYYSNKLFTIKINNIIANKEDVLALLKLVSDGIITIQIAENHNLELHIITL